MLAVRSFTRRYDDLCAVDDLSFEVAAGEILGLVGPNGAGKTTTLRALAAIVAPTLGTLEVAGFDVVEQPIAAKRRLAYVPDTPHPFDLLTVAEHLRFTALAYRVRDHEARADELLEELELVEKRDALASTLSRGMQQKLFLACAFLRRPDGILLDEPLTGLDPRGIRSTRDAIARRAEEGAAIVISSHLLELVERLCHRVLILDRGRCVALGTLAEVRALAAKGDDATLEEVFFAVTERGAPPRGEPA